MRVAVAADVVRGLAFLHSRDVMFRDLKSSNVILNYESDHRPRFRCGIDAAAEIVQRRQLDGVARGSSTSAHPTTMRHGRSPHPAVHLRRVQQSSHCSLFTHHTRPVWSGRVHHTCSSKRLWLRPEHAPVRFDLVHHF
ncbi:hypothetical protein QYE76_046769 [Lolium multiflorum]|uniref:Protein kinase domain-containing protein n=1 Tax=Lolium multiflorum TaxID=4521 RepID=A0AAD8X100_LOLMU|nr:hypothetical protein QYE76_046769 [Lolium multiflorum]